MDVLDYIFLMANKMEPKFIAELLHMSTTKKTSYHRQYQAVCTNAIVTLDIKLGAPGSSEETQFDYTYPDTWVECKKE